MKTCTILATLLLVSACGGLPEGQADGGITRAETEQLNEAADILDNQSTQPPQDDTASPVAEKP